VRLKATHKFTPLGIQKLTAKGRYSDGANLYVVVSATGTKSFAFIYRFANRTRHAGLGSVDRVTLKEARRRAAEGNELLSRKPPQDPLEIWRRPEASQIPNFAQSARTYIEGKKKAWRSAKQLRQVTAMLTKHCEAIARIPVNEIATPDVMKVIKPFFDRTPDSALRLRMHIEAVINAARADGHIPTEQPNPARLKGHLEFKLPKGAAAARRTHFAAMPYAEVPAFVVELRGLRQDTDGRINIAAYALESHFWDP
jgi:hypothetical protein